MGGGTVSLQGVNATGGVLAQASTGALYLFGAVTADGVLGSFVNTLTLDTESGVGILLMGLTGVQSDIALNATSGAVYLNGGNGAAVVFGTIAAGGHVTSVDHVAPASARSTMVSVSALSLPQVS